MPRGPDASSPSVDEEQRVGGGQLTECRRQEFRTDWFDPRPFVDIVPQQLLERSSLGDMLLEETAIALVAELGKQGCEGRLYVADEPQIDCGAPSDMFWVDVDLDFLDIASWKKFRKRKVGA